MPWKRIRQSRAGGVVRRSEAAADLAAHIVAAEGFGLPDSLAGGPVRNFV